MPKHYDSGMLATVAAALMGNNPSKYARLTPQMDEQFGLAAEDARKLVDACDCECAKANSSAPEPVNDSVELPVQTKPQAVPHSSVPSKASGRAAHNLLEEMDK